MFARGQHKHGAAAEVSPVLEQVAGDKRLHTNTREQEQARGRLEYREQEQVPSKIEQLAVS